MSLWSRTIPAFLSNIRISGSFPLVTSVSSPVSAVTSQSVPHRSLKDFYFQKADEEDVFEGVKGAESGFCSGLAPRNNVIPRVVCNGI